MASLIDRWWLVDTLRKLLYSMMNTQNFSIKTRVFKLLLIYWMIYTVLGWLQLFTTAFMGVLAIVYSWILISLKYTQFVLDSEILKLFDHLKISECLIYLIWVQFLHSKLNSGILVFGQCIFPYWNIFKAIKGWFFLASNACILAAIQVSAGG